MTATPLTVRHQPYVSVSSLWEHLKTLGIEYVGEDEDGKETLTVVTREDIDEIEQGFFNCGQWDFTWGDNNRSMISCDTFAGALEGLDGFDSAMMDAVLTTLRTIFDGLDRVNIPAGLDTPLSGTALIDLEN